MKVKIRDSGVKMSLNTFSKLLDQLRDAKETSEANEWLSNARVNLISEIATLEEKLRERTRPNIRVLRLKDGNHYQARVLSIEGDIATLTVTIAD